MKEKRESYYEDYECGKMDALGPSLPYVTLISSRVLSHRCPYLGRYMATGVIKDGRFVADLCATASVSHEAFHSWVVGCGHSATMEFHSKCVNKEPVTG